MILNQSNNLLDYENTNEYKNVMDRDIFIARNEIGNISHINDSPIESSSIPFIQEDPHPSMNLSSTAVCVQLKEIETYDLYENTFEIDNNVYENTLPIIDYIKLSYTFDSVEKEVFIRPYKITKTSSKYIFHLDKNIDFKQNLGISVTDVHLAKCEIPKITFIDDTNFKLSIENNVSKCEIFWLSNGTHFNRIFINPLGISLLNTDMYLYDILSNDVAIWDDFKTSSQIYKDNYSNNRYYTKIEYGSLFRQTVDSCTIKFNSTNNFNELGTSMYFVSYDDYSKETVFVEDKEDPSQQPIPSTVMVGFFKNSDSLSTKYEIIKLKEECFPISLITSFSYNRDIVSKQEVSSKHSINTTKEYSDKYKLEISIKESELYKEFDLDHFFDKNSVYRLYYFNEEEVNNYVR